MQHLTEYFDVNIPSESDPSLLWNACKMYIRGIILKMCAQAKGQSKEKLTSLLSDIHETDTKYKTEPDPILTPSLLKLNQELQELWVINMINIHLL